MKIVRGFSKVGATLRTNCSTYNAAAAISSHARGTDALLRTVEVGQKDTNRNAYVGC